MKRWALGIAAAAVLFACAAQAAEVNIVALGASNTYGSGRGLTNGGGPSSQAYPAQLQAILKSSGKSVRVINAGVNGNTTEGMLKRLDRAVPNGTSLVILQPGGNDRRKGTSDRTSEIQSRLSARGIPVMMLSNSMLSGLPHQPDGIHLTPEGYAMLARSIAPSVQGAMR